MVVTSDHLGRNVTVSSETVNPVTLEEVNENLLKRLNELIKDAEPEQILDITEAVAKLNASRRNSDQFNRPETSEEKTEREQREMFGAVLSGEVVDEKTRK